MYRYLCWLAPILLAGPVAAGPPARSSAAPPSAAPAPRIIPGEQLRLTVTGEAELSGVHQVDLEGKIQLPMVGPVRVAGLTYEQARAAIERALREYLKNPVVTLQPATPLRVAVVGGVLRPGYVEYAAGMTASQALAAAGGPTPGARLKDAYVIRQALNQPTRPERLKVNLKDVGSRKHPDVALLSGDLLFIPQPRVRDRDDPLLRLLGLAGLFF